MSRTLILFATLFVVLAGILFFRDYRRSEAPLPTASLETSQMAKGQEIGNINEWREFSFKPAHFKVWLPALPQHVTDTVIDQKTQESHKYETFATAGDSGAAFMVNAITMSGAIPPSEEALKKVVSSMLERNKDNTLNKMTMGTFQGMRALDFSLNNGNVLIVGKVFAHDDTVYILSMVDEKNRFNVKEFDFFVNSFEFTE